jgi:serine/threonine-protein kinase
MIEAGTRIGPYEVTSTLGSGGMGEVYRARDTKLGRDVALKILPDLFATDPDRLARFQREAAVLAALNHPHIAAIYGLEDSANVRALVLELVEGPTLADRVGQGLIPLDEALAIGRQIADALEAAHQKGIVHRDLKPANVKLRPDGTVKVLDFGLAKIIDDSATAVSSVSMSTMPHYTESPTMTSPALTRMGVIVGTAAYMSPEQARGKPVDKRADIWAFGCVLFEMLTGKRPFIGEDVTETLAAIVKETPDLGRVPPSLRRLLRKCLEKDPKKRLRDIGDAWDLMDVDSEQRTFTSGLVWKAVAAVTAAMAVVALWAPWRSAPPDRPLMRLDLDVGTGLQTPPIIAPDGTRIAYVAQGRLLTRRLDQTDPVELVRLEGAPEFANPFFSPDGTWIGFINQSRFPGGRPSALKKISVDGGASITLAEFNGPALGASWSDDHTIVMATPQGLRQVPEAGGDPKPLTQSAPGSSADRWPQVLPRGQAVLVTTVSQSFVAVGPATTTIDLVSLTNGDRKTILKRGAYARYLPTSGATGHIVYLIDGTVFAVPFDPNHGQSLGTPAAVVEDVAYVPAVGRALYEASESGAFAYVKGKALVGFAGPTILGWIDVAGKASQLMVPTRDYQHPRISPNGERVAIDVAQQRGSDIWVYDVRRENMERLTNDGTSYNALWTPDGRQIVYEGTDGISWLRADSPTESKVLVPADKNGRLIPSSFPADGRAAGLLQRHVYWWRRDLDGTHRESR